MGACASLKGGKSPVATNVEEPSQDGTQRRRLSIANAQGGSATERDERRRRLSIVNGTPGTPAEGAIPSEDPHNEVDENGIMYSMSTPSSQKASELPITFGLFSRPGNDPMKRKKENQDACIVYDKFGNNPQQMFFGVWDGHGPNGAFVSHYIMDQLPKSHISRLSVDTDVHEAIKNACLETSRALHMSSIDVYVSGTTSITAFLRGNTFYCGNVGDSRCILGRKDGDNGFVAVDLSIDQKPDREDEMRRIIESGGRVFEWGVPRVWLKEVDLPGLAMSRSFGDLAAESVGVFAIPEISQVDLSADDKFIVLASDGVWEFLESQNVVDIVKDFYERDPTDPQKACDELVAEAVRQWNRNEDVVDDTTAIVAFLSFP